MEMQSETLIPVSLENCRESAEIPNRNLRNIIFMPSRNRHARRRYLDYLVITLRGNSVQTPPVRLKALRFLFPAESFSACL